MRSLSVALICLSLAIPTLAAAQGVGEAAAPIEDKPEVKINEVERGFFFGTQAGGTFLFAPNGSAGKGLSFGRSVGVTVGADIGDLFSLGVLVLGTYVDTPAGFVSESGMKGDFSTLTLGLLARANVYGTPDTNGIERFYIDVHAGGGFGLMSPKGAFAGSDITVLGGAGLQYFTHLRHFSIGLDADFVMGLSNMGPGLMLSPQLRYTF